MGKRLAVLLGGHLRTYENTYKNFLENIVASNQKDGWEIDIFIHTWDKLSSSVGSWHKGVHLVNERPLTSQDLENINDFYHPVKYLVETLPENTQGYFLTKKALNKMVDEYERQENIKYDYNLITRPDIFFATPLHISKYIDFAMENGMLGGG